LYVTRFQYFSVEGCGKVKWVRTADRYLGALKPIGGNLSGTGWKLALLAGF
jgi:hypothetical protein